VLRVSLPLTVRLKRGTRVLVDQSLLGTSDYDFCMKSGCTASGDSGICLWHSGTPAARVQTLTN